MSCDFHPHIVLPPYTTFPASQKSGFYLHKLPATARGDPDLRHKAGLGINRQTWSWNAAAAVFAYGYATLAELQYKYVGQDQLIGGTWPDVSRAERRSVRA